MFGLTLEGASDGISYYLSPDPEKLGDIGVWKDAAIQIFYSLGISSGGLTTLSSYNKFNNNCHRDAWLIALINCGTSFFAGFVIFSILGFMANKTGEDIGNVVQSGSALAFVVYPEAVLHMPIPQIWSFLFFFMLLTLGLDSMFAGVEAITTCVIDHFSLTRKKHYVVIGTCITMFLCGLPMCCKGGYYLFDLLDNVSFSWNALMCALLEVIIVAWFYGVKNLNKDIREMGIRIPKILQYYWNICWWLITPALVLFLVVMSFVNHTPFRLDNYVYPDGIQILAWIIPSSCIALIPLFGIHYMVSRYRNNVEFARTCNNLFQELFEPTSNWGPQETFTEKVAANHLTIDQELRGA